MDDSAAYKALDAFSPAVRAWFRETFGQPTPPQVQGWPPVRAGENTIILAPTGSGKTLAAFLWGIDRIYAELEAGITSPGIRLLYVSPLKALNNDIERNLRAPLEGIRRAATRLGQALPPLRVAVRTGDTPTSARTSMLYHPPHLLITTPESLYLMLTSPRARELFTQVQTVIVDEIHTLCGNKRGVHLALSLERLEHLVGRPVQRLGLSATQKPLEEVARYLGGQSWQTALDGSRQLVPRPVTIVDAGYQKPLDLKVITTMADFRELAGESIWPTIIPQLVELIRQHRTTLIYVNNRRLAERIADKLNEHFGPGVIRAHHGSMSREARLRMEADLKAGRLPALVGTSSLELGIDIGAVDLVVQLQSPRGVARGLQRVGRSGHLVGETSRGRIFATHREDLMEAAAVAGGMRRGEVEPTYTPQNCLDVLAQQVVAAVSVESWDTSELYDLVRQAYPYHGLSRAAFDSVLEMLSGRYPSQAFRELRARISWDRTHDRLYALPGSRLLALSNPGTITDRGAFGAYLADGTTKIGELDEEFVYETRAGDAFILGSQTWRALDITADRVIVAEAPEAVPRMPFWRGDLPWRPYELGIAIGRFRREVARRIDSPDLLRWLQDEYGLDENSAHNVASYVRRQLDAAGEISSDKTVIVELFQDAIGDYQLVVHSTFGGRVNGPWALAIASLLRESTGVEVETQISDDGILFRFPRSDATPPLNITQRLPPAEARERLLAALPDSPLFGAQFRQNAARALLLPRARAGRRTPFWLQRLRSKDLLQIARRYESFPIVAETYRYCLRDVMDLAHLEEVLARLQSGEIKVVAVQTAVPSPMAASLLFNFIGVYMYEWDAPKAERQIQSVALNRELLQDLLGEPSLAGMLRPQAIAQVEARLQHTAPEYLARSPEELAQFLWEMGDLGAEEAQASSAGDAGGWLTDLAAQRRVAQIDLPGVEESPRRWVLMELLEEYRHAFNPGPAVSAGETDRARLAVLRRYLATHGPTTTQALGARYRFPAEWLEKALERLVASREGRPGRFTPEVETDQWCDRRVLEQLHRGTLTLLRREVRPVSPAVYADFLLRWQHLHPADRLSGPLGLERALRQLEGLPVPASLWERHLLPGRLVDFQPEALETLCQEGQVVWVASGGKDPRRARVALIFRGNGSLFLEGVGPEEAGLSDSARAVWEALRSEGACFTADLESVTGLTGPALQEAIVELAMAGLVTNDRLEAMRRIMAYDSTETEPAAKTPLSTLEAQLAERLVTPRRGAYAEYRAAKSRVARRMRQPPRWGGRWSLVHRRDILGPDPEDKNKRRTDLLLNRYGVVSREALEREGLGWDWAQLYGELQRMEYRGEARRGYFVAGLSGVQFALPTAVETLRQVAAGESQDDEPLPVVNAADPANIWGPELPGGPADASGKAFTFARVPTTWCVLRRGLPVLVAQDDGARLSTAQGLDENTARRAAMAFLEHIKRDRARLTVDEWDGSPVLASHGRGLLESLGFRPDWPGMTWERIPGGSL
jgi:ATP-dependent Lhr-like helicase